MAESATDETKPDSEEIIIGESPPGGKASVRGNYRSLDPARIMETIDVLCHRTQERFAGRGISEICQHLREIASHSQATAEAIARPIIWVRVGTALLSALILIGLVGSILALNPTQKALTLVEFVQALEAGINDLVLVGAGIFFLVTLEIRIKRKRALKALHELRSLIHIIDMHQLTKDPERLLSEHSRTDSSPAADMTSFQLNRYLDYCSEMLSLCAKLAALQAQNFNDSVVLSAVGELETLALGLSNNVWQKIAILQTMEEKA